MNFYFAPMEGVAGYIYRNIHREYFKSVDKYFSPFVCTRASGIMKNREMKDILPENNKDMHLVPQIMTNNAQGFCNAAEQMAEFGYDEVNLNLGCPSGTVTGKGRGSGFLRHPEELDAFLDEIYNNCNIKISVKTRIGFSEPEEMYNLMKIYNKYPVYELIIHPRTRMDMYKNPVNMEIFADAFNSSANPVCYNGDIRSKADYEMVIEKFPQLDRVMIGRGFLYNPNIVGDITGTETMDKRMFKEYHDRVYDAYREIYDGERSVLFKMKELWFHMGPAFTGYDKYLKKIRKAQHLTEYNVVVALLFKEQELNY